MTFFKLLEYGPAGNGKTTLLGTVVEDERLMPALGIDFEGGMVDAIGSKLNTISSKDLKTHKPSMDKISHIVVKEWAELQDIYDILDEKMFKTIMADSLSEINFMNLYTLSNKQTTKRPILANLKMPQLNDYGNSAFQMNVLVRAFRDLDCNLVCTAGVDRAASKLTGTERLVPQMVGKFREKISHIFGQVGYLGIHPGDDIVEAGTRVLIVKGSEDMEAKFRDEQRKVEDMIINPTLSKIYDRVNGIYNT